jgi:hypothetical protein
MDLRVGQLDEQVFTLDRRLTETEGATDALIGELERERAELRRRLEALAARDVAPAPGPRLVGGMDVTHGDDAAAA